MRHKGPRVREQTSKDLNVTFCVTFKEFREAKKRTFQLVVEKEADDNRNRFTMPIPIEQLLTEGETLEEDEIHEEILVQLAEKSSETG